LNPIQAVIDFPVLKTVKKINKPLAMALSRDVKEIHVSVRQSWAYLKKAGKLLGIQGHLPTPFRLRRGWVGMGNQSRKVWLPFLWRPRNLLNEKWKTLFKMKRRS